MGQNGLNAEAGCQKALEQELLHPQRKSFIEVLSQMPDVGLDSDSERVQGNAIGDNEVFD